MKPAANCKRRDKRRQHERRSNPYAFNSEAWIAVVSQYYSLWPKQDRRIRDRRSGDRRLLQEHSIPSAFAPTALTVGNLLSDEEKQMIRKLFC